MTQAEKLEALVRRAVDSGWHERGTDVENIVREALHECYEPEFSVIDIIFNHDFARALFGDETVYIPYGHERGEYHELPRFKHELQQAVINEDPIGYMYGEVFGE